MKKLQLLRELGFARFLVLLFLGQIQKCGPIGQRTLETCTASPDFPPFLASTSLCTGTTNSNSILAVQ